MREKGSRQMRPLGHVQPCGQFRAIWAGEGNAFDGHVALQFACPKGDMFGGLIKGRGGTLTQA